MNFEKMFKELDQDILSFKKDTEDRAKSLSNQLSYIKKSYKSCKDFTSIFLSNCKKLGIKKVSIQRAHGSIPKSKDFPFGVEGSIFTTYSRDEHGTPNLWIAVGQSQIKSSCGNGDQTQCDCSNLVDGVYHLKEGRWKKVN